MKNLSKDEMKKVMGGGTTYQCTCVGSVGQWIYSGNERPSDSRVATDIQENCRSGHADCGYTVLQYA